MSSLLKIITIDGPQQEVLKQKTDNIKENEFPVALKIADKLKQALEPYFPAAGLAAPQIGISKSIFIYSYDRNPQHLEVIINPVFMPLGQEQIESWEGCFSLLLSQGNWEIAKVPRFKRIQATYQNISGMKIEKTLEGFAAKVFQHEYDHLQGILNVHRSDAIVKKFTSRQELSQFLEHMKGEDARSY